MKVAIIVHGGAGAWDLAGKGIQGGLVGCREAAIAGQAVLLAGGSALDAVETAVRVLEDNPYLDAGRGSFFNTNNEIEMDALIMDGRSLDMGAIAAVQRIQNPISLARRVMEDSPHAFFVGKGAEAFADSLGLPRCELVDLIGHTGEFVASEDGPIGDTVGAVAIDEQGNLAAATSTGGTPGKMPGRIGDSPLVGSGGYADNFSAAASATGYGEALMKIVISKQICDYVASGLSAKAACDAAICLLEERTGKEGGVISIDRHGRVGWAFNTTAMPYAYVVGDGVVVDGR